MLYKLTCAIRKEFLLLSRDIGGMVIIFLMPLVLVVMVTLIQDIQFKNYEEVKIPIVFVDNDKGEVSQLIVEQIKKRKSLELVTKNYTEESAKNAVFGGEYQLAIVLPENLSDNLNENIKEKVDGILSNLGYSESNAATTEKISTNNKNVPKEIHFYFDPATNVYFKNDIHNTINKMIVDIENQKIYETFKDQLGSDVKMKDTKTLISYKEILPEKNKKEIKPNSVQHNVPAWTLVAMFFIVIPLSVNLVKEKNQGTVVRILSSPTPYWVHVLGKTFTYVLICLLQFLMMLAVGILIFPYLGLPSLDISGQLFKLILVTLFAGLAAVGFGVLIGTVAKTQEQGAPFGATAVIVLAALGGTFVPVFLMPDFLKMLSQISPMSWGLQAYQDIILRHADLISLLPNIALLLLFYIVTVTIALLYEKRNHSL